ncbi:hypothetical protein [Arthrobacter sp. Br18]|uniref:hypothetical protein n=1 Tax=Arthrobacter sp. Br18 TaxID=1312954 RepID=UPI00047C74D1|nr:hypothetical protein [Arthrobacter sp. Br18]
MDRFVGHIAGIGTAAGTRLVVGLWDSSRFGRFADVMVETAAGHRTLLAPERGIADYVRATYTFDEVVITPVTWTLTRQQLTLDAGVLRLSADIGRTTVLGRALALIPARLAASPRWLTLVNPLARMMMKGVRTAGSAGNGRREYYGVLSIRSITGASASWNGQDLGALAPVTPPVRFGFSSAPPAPALVAVVTTILHATGQAA